MKFSVVCNPLNFRSSYAKARCTSRGITLIELLVASALSLLILSAVAGTLLEVFRISKSSETTLDAVANARQAIETISNEVKAASRVPGSTLFVGENVPLSFGDGFDNDGDGRIDEEFPNGLDDDGDWTVAGDQHALLTLRRERPLRVGLADLGDKGVDEDNRFNLDRLTFRIVPNITTDYLYENIRYEVTTFEGQGRVLVRRSDKFMTATSQFQTTTAPLAYNVLSFNLLYWNPNAQPKDQYWDETWNSAGPFNAPGFELPAGVWVEIVVYSDPKDISKYVDGQQVGTEAVRSIINIENVIQDAAFPRTP